MEFDAPISVEAHRKVGAKPIRSCHWVKQYPFRGLVSLPNSVPDRRILSWVPRRHHHGAAIDTGKTAMPNLRCPSAL
jgi:hypothetical protein